MIQVKKFKNPFFNNVEEQLNEWLMTKKPEDIISITKKWGYGILVVYKVEPLK